MLWIQIPVDFVFFRNPSRDKLEDNGIISYLFIVKILDFRKNAEENYENKSEVFIV